MSIQIFLRYNLLNINIMKLKTHNKKKIKRVIFIMTRDSSSKVCYRIYDNSKSDGVLTLIYASFSCINV